MIVRNADALSTGAMHVGSQKTGSRLFVISNTVKSARSVCMIIDEAETIRGPVRIEGQQKTVNISNIQDTKKWVEQGG